jgi:hypothetical protein
MLGGGSTYAVNGEGSVAGVGTSSAPPPQAQAPVFEDRSSATAPKRPWADDEADTAHGALIQLPQPYP